MDSGKSEDRKDKKPKGEKKNKNESGRGDSLETRNRAEENRKKASQSQSKPKPPPAKSWDTGPGTGNESGWHTSSDKESKKRNTKESTEMIAELAITEISSVAPEIKNINSTSCLELNDFDDSEDDDEEEGAEGGRGESFDPISIGEEIMEELWITVRGICAERFFHENAPAFVTLELRNTWLRIMEAEWLDEYKPEVGTLFDAMFLRDDPPPPIPFDTWSRGTLEVLNPDLPKGVRSTKSMKQNVTMKFDDVFHADIAEGTANNTQRKSWRMDMNSGREGNDLRFPEEPFITLFRKPFSRTRLTPEDGFNIPFTRYSSAAFNNLKPPLKIQAPLDVNPGAQVVAIGKDDYDDPTTTVVRRPRVERKRTFGFGSVNPKIASDEKAGVLVVVTENEPSVAIEPHSIASSTDIDVKDEGMFQQQAPSRDFRSTHSANQKKKQLRHTLSHESSLLLKLRGQ